MGFVVCDGLTSTSLRRHFVEGSDGFTESWLCRHKWCFAVLQFLMSLMDLRGEGSVQDSGETSVLCCFCFFPSSLALVNGCTLWPQPGALGSVVNVAAAMGPMTGKNTLTNSPSEPHLKAFRVDLRCSGKPSVSPMSKVCRGHNDHAKACCGTYCAENARIECGGVSCQLSHVRVGGQR